MAYDIKIAERIFDILSDKEGITSKKMFGGLCFMLNGNMLCGVVKDKLMLRVGKDAYSKCIRLRYTQEMDFTGRPMKGFVLIEPEGIDMDEDLEYWIQLALDYNPKAKSSKSKKKV